MAERLTRAAASQRGLIPEQSGVGPSGAAPAGPRIVHLGFGAFARAHTAVYTEEANRAAETPWRILGVTQRSSTVADQLNPQDGLYTVVEEGPDAAGAQLITCVEHILSGPEQPHAVVEAIASAQTHVVTLTITEKGYRTDPRTGGVDTSDHAVAEELAGSSPRTAIGQIVRGVQRRAQAGAGPLTVVSCDNLPGNGARTAAVVRSFAEALPQRESAELLDWIDAHVSFPNTMVDRMVPRPTEATAQAVERSMGLTDGGAVPSEHFTQWVIEDSFAGPRPPWETAGAEFSHQVERWEHTKLRMLNAAHSLLAYLGHWAGHRTIAEAVGDSAFALACRQLHTAEVLPTLALPDCVDGAAYGEQVLRRFANPALGHTTAKVGADGSQKLGPRLLATVQGCLEAGRTPQFAALTTAAWMHHVAEGPQEAVDDPLADQLRLRAREAATAEETISALLRESAVLPEAVASSEPFRGRVVHWYRVLQLRDAETLRKEIGEARHT